MIKRPDKLFDFVQSMSSHERGYFKQHSSKNSYYVTLFDAVCRQQVYNEEELAKTLKQAGCTRKLSAIKDYLWKELTQVMTPYHLDKTPVGEALMQIQRLHLMKEKGLTEGVYKELDSLKKHCANYELFDTYLHVLHLQYGFSLMQLDLKEDFWPEVHKAIYSITLYANLSEIKHRLSTIKAKPQGRSISQTEMSEIEALVSHRAMRDKVFEESVRLRILKEEIWEMYAFLKRDYEAMVKHNMNIVAFMESKFYQLKDSRDVSAVYCNIISSLTHAGQRRQLAGVVNDITSRLENETDNHAETLGHLLTVKVIRSIVLNEFDELQKLVCEFKSSFPKFSINVKHKVYYFIAIAFIESGRYEAALDWVNEALVFYRKHKHVSGFYLDKLRLLHLLLYMQMGDYQFAGNTVDSFIRTYTPVQKERDLTLFVLKQVKKLIRRQVKGGNKLQIEKGKVKAVNPNENGLFVDTILWLNCIAAGTDFANENSIAVKALLAKP